MRAHTITTINRRRRNARRRRALALAIGICALAIPATASADPPASGYSRADAIAQGLEESSQPTSGSDYSSVNSIAPPASSPSGSGGWRRRTPVRSPGSDWGSPLRFIDRCALSLSRESRSAVFLGVLITRRVA
jgi:hypothetical protein